MQRVELGSPASYFDVIGQMSPSEVARMRRLLGGKIRCIRTLLDCPAYEVSFRPFFFSSPDDPAVLFTPGKPDTGPLSASLSKALDLLP